MRSYILWMVALLAGAEGRGSFAPAFVSSSSRRVSRRPPPLIGTVATSEKKNSSLSTIGTRLFVAEVGRKGKDPATNDGDLDVTPLAFGTPPEPERVLPPRSSTTAPAIELPMLQLALAGSLTTLFSDVTMHPMDCVKTLQQSDSFLGLSLPQTAAYLWETSGIAGFYHGFLTYGLADAVGGALKFSVWELWKKRTERWDFAGSLWIGAALAFIASSFVLVPGELIKNQLQMSRYDGLLEAARGIYAQSGLPGFFVGYDAVLYRDVPYTVLELSLYEHFKNYLDARRPANEEASSLEEVAAAAVTGAVTAVLTTPLDTIKTKLMVDAQYADRGFLECLAGTVENHGAPSFFAGALARVAWIVPYTALYLPTYDLLKRQLYNNWTAENQMMEQPLPKAQEE